MKVIGIVCACVCVACYFILKWMERNKVKGKKRAQTANNDDAVQFFGAAGKLTLWLILVAVVVFLVLLLTTGLGNGFLQIFSK